MVTEGQGKAKRWGKKTYVERDVYTVREAAEKLRVHFNTVYRLIASGEIQAVRVGKRRFVSKAVLDGMLAGKG